MNVTMDDVAAAAKVSRSLVSLVFQDSPKVSARSRKKVLEAAERLGYRPNAMARSLASKTNRVVGVLLNDIANPYFARVYEALLESLEAKGYRILLGAGQRSTSREESIVTSFLEHRVGGLLLVSPRMSVRELERASGGLPTVVIGKDVNLPNMDSVQNDEFVGARLAIDHLYELGHRNILHVTGGTGAGASDRKAGYLASMAGVGLKTKAEVIPGDFTEAAGRQAARTLLKREQLPTAIFAANDLVAVGLMGTLQAAGVRIPRDISIVGYDNSSLAGLGLVELTTIEQPLADFGPAATSLLIDRIENGRTKRVVEEYEPKLIVRGSTAKPRRD